MGIQRPRCEWGGIGGCERPATWMIGFVHSDRFRLSCKDHLKSWAKHGRGYWCSELQGFVGDWDHVMEDIMIDNRLKGEAREAGALRATEEFQFDKMRKMSAAMAARDGSENVGGEEVTLLDAET